MFEKDRQVKFEVNLKEKLNCINVPLVISPFLFKKQKLPIYFKK